MQKTRKKWDRQRLRRLRKLVLTGYNDPEIAERMEASAQVVGRQRRKFGLPSPGNGSVGSRKKQATIMRRRNKRVPTELAHCEAAKMGWMDARGPAHARVLDVLLTRPRTAHEVSEVLGIQCCTVYSYLRELKWDRMITVAGREPVARSRSRIVWRLADGIMRHTTSIKHKYDGNER